MTEFSSHIVTALYLVNILFAFTIIFLERRNPTSTLAWVLVLFLLPAVGAIFYILLSQNLTRKKMFGLGANEQLQYASLLTKEIEDLRSGRICLKDPMMENYKDLIHLHQVQSKALFSQDNCVEVFTDGKEKFKELFKCIINAKSQIHILYFIV